MIHRSQSAYLVGVPLGKKAVITASGIKYVEHMDYAPEYDGPEEMPFEKPKEKEKRPPRPLVKNDPKLITFTCELRDRFLEQVNDPDSPALLPEAKYHVARLLEHKGANVTVNVSTKETPLLDAA